jgi:hypothetical protein
MGNDIVFPAAGYVAMAVEAVRQARLGIHLTEGSPLTEKARYRLRDVIFPKALVLEENGEGSRIMLSLTKILGSKDSWHEFRVTSITNGVWSEHSRGLVGVEAYTKKGES